MKGLSVVPLLAKRFLLSKSADGFLSLIAWVSIVGVALGVLALTVVTSVINGFEGELVRVITGMNGDVILYSRGEPITESEKVEAKIRQTAPEVKQITASFVTELMISGAAGVAGGVLEGIDLKTVGKVTDVPKRVVEGRLPAGEGEVALGSALAERIGVRPGMDVRLIAPFIGDGSGGNSSAPKAIPSKVVGIVRMGMHEYDSKFIFAPIRSVQSALKQPDRVTSFKMKLNNPDSARAVADRLGESFGYPFRAKDWAQFNKNLFYAIRLEKVVIAIILTAIVIVAAFNVVSTLMMMIHDKTREIAILKAMGFRPAQSFRLFVLIGMSIGIVGTAIGAALGLSLNVLLHQTNWIRLPEEIYYIGFLPVVVRWTELSLIGFAALLITFAATLYPSLKVSSLPPLQGLRYD